ncbi:conserved Plasmodium protein, unknown function [Plasmodium relictum]|uniref:Thioredoxin domain-containing protein n=1 Tax=Plasmodium relictum TaxID=85471 RepID=A0A1J1HCE1_PLARL|nr:conserved Plasmodium protein, unknown function [Plasmodium relictum]CRH02766.1 conserved Plasmodium protein, unknown function [Plasmodium relictum]
MPFFNKSMHKIKNILKCKYKRKYMYFSSQYICSNNIEKTPSKYAKPIELKEYENFLKVLQNNNIIINEIGKFVLVKKNSNLLYDRILFNPSNFDKLVEFVQFLEKNEIKNDFDIYFYEESLSNIKLNRDQNKKEIFINIKNIMENKKIKSDEKKTYLEKKNINSLYYYNIQRYEDNVDPSSFLIDRKRLTKEEYTYQYISTILPYICFTFMLFFPHFLICLFIPHIKKKNEKQRELCKILQIKQNIHSYKDIKPEHITSIIDNNIKTIVFFYSNNIFLNMYIKSLLVDLSKIFKDNSISVNIVGIDISKYNIQYNMIKDFNENLFPLIYFILPYHYDNDSAVLKIEKPLTVENIVSQIKDFIHIPQSTYNQIKTLDNIGSKLKRCVFKHEIMNKKKEDIIYDYGSEIAHLSCLIFNNKELFY